VSAPVATVDGPPAAGWWLWRQDDNANVLLVARFHSRAAAEEARCRFEARGHRQVYWVTAPSDHSRGHTPEHAAAETRA